MEETTKTAKPGARQVLPAHVLVFIAGFCLMVIELVASRIVAPYLGSSLYTWTGVIGVVLAGIAVGNYTGGMAAEKGVNKRTVGLIFILAGFVAILAFFMSRPLADVIRDIRPQLPVAIILFSVLEFFPVSFLLSNITPIVIASSLDSLQKTGTTVGRIYAVSSLASILGTFAAGYVLIPLLGVKTIMLCVGAILIMTGVIVGRPQTTKVSLTAMVFVGLLYATLFLPKFCDSETRYYCLRITPVQAAEGIVRYLRLDCLVHSKVSLEPRRLGYDYESAYAVVTEYLQEQMAGQPIRAMFIGGGGYVMPRYMEEVYPDSQLTVAEIDPGVTEMNIKYLGLNPEGRIHTVNEDARQFLVSEDARGQTYDIVFGDAYNDIAIPFHLTTKEFFQLVRDHLSPGGIYALNIIDANNQGRLWSSFMRTAAEVFPYIEMATLDVEWQKNPWRTTFVLLASNEPIDQDRWRAAADTAYAERLLPPAPVSLEAAVYLMTDKEKEEMMNSHKGLVLTDDYVPVDSLTTPLFRDIY
jgi:spermidine synthase